MQNVEGKVAFITGGASGIGLGMAIAFVHAHMRVVISDFRQDHLEDSIAYFKQKGLDNNVHHLRLDVTDRQRFAGLRMKPSGRSGKRTSLQQCRHRGGWTDKACEIRRLGLGPGVMIGGVVNGIQTFLPRILKDGEGGRIHHFLDGGTPPLPKARFIRPPKRAS